MENRFCFLAIVRDESAVIERCLESVKNIATSYLICDTGSKDDTITKIHAFTKEYNIPGEVISREWVSYGDNKSELLRVFRDHPVVGKAKYICLLDADEVFITDPKNPTCYPTREDAENLYYYLEQREENVFRITTIYESLTYNRWQFARNDQLYEWRLPYQEYFVGTAYHRDHQINLPLWNLARHQGNSSKDPSITKKRIEMAEKWIEKNPTSDDMSRMIFYLAEAYIGIDTARAITLYKERLQMDGYVQEKYISFLKLAKLDDESKLFYLSNAQKLIPTRLEAFYDMFMHFYNLGNHTEAARIFLGSPSSRNPPEGSLFVHYNVYNYLFDMNGSVSLYRAGKYKEAYEVGLSLLTRKTYPPCEEEQVEKNMKFFREKYSPNLSMKNYGELLAPLPSAIIIDNFYDDPMAVREKALRMEYTVRGNYPGVRTESIATDLDKQRFESILGRKITYWPSQYNGSFQYTTRQQKSWIHRDPTDFSAVIYLTPNAPVKGGTVIYRHKATGLERTIEGSPEDIRLNNDGNDESLWEVVDVVGNKFNRAIIFQGGVSHKSNVYFGDDLRTGRLFQTFFFNVEGRKY